MELQPNPTNIVAVVVSALFIAMIWNIPTWASYPLRNKIIITVALPIISYLIGSFFADR